MSGRTNKYRCPACGQIVEQESSKQWVESYCDQAGEMTRLQKIKPTPCELCTLYPFCSAADNQEHPNAPECFKP